MVDLSPHCSPLLALDHGGGAVIMSRHHPDLRFGDRPLQRPADGLGPIQIIDGVMATAGPAIPDDDVHVHPRS